jgi:hypothetical protein
MSRYDSSKILDKILDTSEKRLTNSDGSAIMMIIGDGFGYSLGLAERPGSYQRRGSSPPFLLWGCGCVKELSIFIDESGSFGMYEPHSPFYLVTLVFHDQSIDISPNLLRLRNSMRERGIQ